MENAGQPHRQVSSIGSTLPSGVTLQLTLIHPTYLILCRNSVRGSNTRLNSLDFFTNLIVVPCSPQLGPSPSFIKRFSSKSSSIKEHQPPGPNHPLTPTSTPSTVSWSINGPFNFSFFQRSSLKIISSGRLETKERDLSLSPPQALQA